MQIERFAGRSVRRRDAVFSLAAGLVAATVGTRSAASSPASGTWSPLHLDSARYLTFPARIDGREVKAIVDSGATRSVIKDGIALDLGLHYLGASLATAFTEQVSGSLYRVNQLEIAGMRFPRLDVASYDVGPIENVAGTVPLIIGQDVLRASALQVDFGRDRARFVDRRADVMMVGAHRLRLAGGDRTTPALPIAIEGRIHEFAMLDLGNNLPLAISRDYAEARGLLAKRPVSTTMTVGIEGPTVSQIVTVAEARIGPFTLRDVPACVVEHWRLAYPITVGWPFFTAFNALYDFGGGSVTLQADPARLAQALPKDRSGLGTVRRPDRINVRHVAYESPAWRAGVREGDEIVAIDGRPIDALYPPAGTRMGQRPAGTAMRLGLADNRDVTLVLADYF